MHWWRRKVREEDLDRELRAHLEAEAEEQQESGLSPEQARFTAQRHLGNITVLKETVREAWGWTSLERLGQDVRYGLRLLRKNPGFGIVAILSLALGIGANTAIFGLIDALLLKSLPVRDPQSLLFLAKQAPQGWDPDFYYETYQRLRARQPFFRELAAYGERVRMNVSVDGMAESTMGQLVSGNYYAVLGVPPVAGRVFTPEDDRIPGAHPVAVISYPYWQRRLAGSPGAIGRKVLIDGTPFTIVGVTPPGFFGLEVGDAPEISVPIMMQPQVMPDKENWLGRAHNTVDWLILFGRLQPDVTIPQATSGLQALFRNIQSQLADEIGLGKATWRQEWVEAKLVLVPGGAGLSHLRRPYTGALYVLMGAVGLVLLIACANVASLLLARASARQREIAVRLAIGAGGARVIRQLLVESLMLSGLGGALGIALSYWVSDLLVRFLSVGGPPLRLDLSPDWRLLGFTAGISVATGILFGLAPAIRGAGFELASVLKQGGRGASPPQRFARALSVVQVALSLVLLVGAGLLVRTLHHLDRIDAGFPRGHVYTVSLSPRGSDQKNGPNGPRLNRLYLDLLERVRAIPGVVSASLAGEPPTMRGYGRPFRIDDGRQVVAHQYPVYPAYFATLGSAIVQGRDFGPADMAEGAPLVAIVNETLARRAFPGESPLGKRIVCTGRISIGESGSPCEVIGVARDIPYATLKDEPRNAIYMTFLQAPTGRGEMELMVRAAGNRTGVPAHLRREIAAIDPYLPAFEVRTLANDVDAALMRERLMALISTVFGALAALLAAIGLYGVVAYSVSRRSQEIGVRMALGALPRRVLALVLGETLALAGVGIACGLPAAFGATRLLAGFLYGVKPADPVVFFAGAGLLTATAVIAGCIPARRAARIDPVAALRDE
ncbi:MAG TPA: ABC transporter permease [Candidatus Acidoferrales bacterium]|nr:ABC transporter permease [Candidatus Acidoferrales bacterium]